MSDLILRFGPVSHRVARRSVLVGGALLLLIVLLAGSGLIGGTYPIEIHDIISSLRGDADPVVQMIVLDNRLPRLLVAIGVGAAFGMAGEMTQTLLRNPLASPDVIGFSAGAGFGAVLSLLITGAAAWVLPGALIGGALAALVLIACTWRHTMSAGAVVLVGIGLSVSLGVLTDLMMARLDAANVAELVKWLIGSVSARDWGEVRLIWLGLALLGPLALWHGFVLARLNLSDDVGRTLGVAVPVGRLITILIAVALVGLAVAAAGPLPFVAFVSGPIAHGLTRAARPSLLPAAMVGALVTLLADRAVQALPGMFVLPTGIFTALIGAPVLIWVLVLQSRKARL